jgi:hypothetical protein
VLLVVVSVGNGRESALPLCQYLSAGPSRPDDETMSNLCQRV